MKLKEFSKEVRRWVAVDAPIREPEYKRRRGWGHGGWILVHCMENWNRSF